MPRFLSTPLLWSKCHKCRNFHAFMNMVIKWRLEELMYTVMLSIVVVIVRFLHFYLPFQVLTNTQLYSLRIGIHSSELHCVNVHSVQRRLTQFLDMSCAAASIIRELLLVKSKTAFISVLGATYIDCIIESLCLLQICFYSNFTRVCFYFTLCTLVYDIMNE